MASDINRVILIGRLVRDPELRHIQSGSSVTNFSVANNRTYVTSGEKKEFTSFFNCVAWGKLGEAIAQYCKKGQRIGLEGRLQQRSWEDQNGQKRSSVEVVVENFQFLSSKQDNQYSKEESPDIPGPPEPAPNDSSNPFSDEEIPF